MTTLWAFLCRDAALRFSYRFALFLRVWSLLFAALTWFLLGRVLPAEALPPEMQGGFFAYVIPGMAWLMVLNTCLGSYSSRLRQEQLTGTLEMALTAPVSHAAVILSLGAFDTLWAVMEGGIMMGIAVLFGMPFNLSGLLGLIPVVFLSLAAYSALGVFSAGMVLLFKRGDPIQMVLSGASFLLGGILFPLSTLPPMVQWIGEILPITHATRATRLLLVEGKGFTDILPTLGVLGLLSLVGLPLALTFFAFCLRISRRRGTLVEY